MRKHNFLPNEHSFGHAWRLQRNGTWFCGGMYGCGRIWVGIDKAKEWKPGLYENYQDFDKNAQLTEET